VNACNHTGRMVWRWSRQMEVGQACRYLQAVPVALTSMLHGRAPWRILLVICAFKLGSADRAPEGSSLAQERAILRSHARTCRGGAARPGGLPLVSAPAGDARGCQPAGWQNPAGCHSQEDASHAALGAPLLLLFAGLRAAAGVRGTQRATLGATASQVWPGCHAVLWAFAQRAFAQSLWMAALSQAAVVATACPVMAASQCRGSSCPLSVNLSPTFCPCG
jgi:hypothetical protein